MTRKHKSAIKAISFLLAFIFAFSEISYAAPFEAAAPREIPLQVIAQDPTRFEAPVKFTTLKEVHKGDKNTFIIHIQDAHANYSGQANLAAALDEIMTRYKVSLVLVEGGTKDDTLTPLKKIAPPEVWKKVAKKFLIEGKITGDEYLNLISDHPMKIMGIENKELYMTSLKAYGDLAGKREAILDYLREIQSAVNQLKRKLYPAELLEYEKTEVQGNEKNFEVRFKRLAQLIESGRIDISSYPGIGRLKEIIDKEKTIDFDAANLEQAALIEEIRKNGGMEEFKDYVTRLSQMKDQRASQFAYFQNTLNIAKGKKISFEKYPNLVAYGEYLKGFQELDLDQVLDELEKVEDKVYLNVISTQIATPRPADQARNDALLVRSVDRYLGLLETAYRIQMSTKEFNLFEVNEPDFATAAYLAFINRKLAEAGYFTDMVAYKNLLEDGRKSLGAFYDSVNQRDMAFMQNAEKILKTENQQVAVLISGGYHTPHLKKLFKEKGYSFAVLTPIITSETNQKKYEKILLEPIRKETKTIEVAQGESKTSDKSLSDLEQDLIKLKKQSDQIAAARLAETDLSGGRLAELVSATGATDEAAAEATLALAVGGRRVEEKAGARLSTPLSQYQEILRSLGDSSPKTSLQILSQTSVPKNKISGRLNHLIKKNLVARSPIQGNKSAYQYNLTLEGKRVVREETEWPFAGAPPSVSNPEIGSARFTVSKLNRVARNSIKLDGARLADNSQHKNPFDDYLSKSFAQLRLRIRTAQEAVQNSQWRLARYALRKAMRLYIELQESGPFIDLSRYSLTLSIYARQMYSVNNGRQWFLLLTPLELMGTVAAATAVGIRYGWNWKVWSAGGIVWGIVLVSGWMLDNRHFNKKYSDWQSFNSAAYGLMPGAFDNSKLADGPVLLRTDKWEEVAGALSAYVQQHQQENLPLAFAATFKGDNRQRVVNANITIGFKPAIKNDEGALQHAFQIFWELITNSQITFLNENNNEEILDFSETDHSYELVDAGLLTTAVPSFIFFTKPRTFRVLSIHLVDKTQNPPDLSGARLAERFDDSRSRGKAYAALEEILSRNLPTGPMSLHERDDIRYSLELISEIQKHPIQNIAVVGSGLRYLPLLLALVGKEVTLIELDAVRVESIKKIKAALETRGHSLSLRFVNKEFGELDAVREGLGPHSFDLVTMIDLLGPRPQGEPVSWYQNAKTLLKENTAYIVMDEQAFTFNKPQNETYLTSFHETFPDKRSVTDQVFYGVYNRTRSSNRFYEIRPGARLAERNKITRRQWLNAGLFGGGIAAIVFGSYNLYESYRRSLIPTKVVGIHVLHGDSLAYIHKAIQSYKKALQDARQRGVKVIAVREISGISIEDLMNLYPNEVRDVDWARLSSNDPDPGDVRKLKVLFIHNARTWIEAINKEILRNVPQEDTQFNNQVNRVLTSAEWDEVVEKIFAETTFLDRAALEKMFSFQLDMWKGRQKLESAILLLNDERKTDRVADALSQMKAYALLISSQIERDKLFLDTLEQIRQQYPGRDIVYDRGIAHSYSSLFKNQFGHAYVDEYAIGDELNNKILNEKLEKIHVEGMNYLNTAEAETILLRILTFARFVDKVPVFKSGDEVFLNAVREWVNSLLKPDLESLLHESINVLQKSKNADGFRINWLKSYLDNERSDSKKEKAKKLLSILEKSGARLALQGRQIVPDNYESDIFTNLETQLDTLREKLNARLSYKKIRQESRPARQLEAIIEQVVDQTAYQLSHPNEALELTPDLVNQVMEEINDLILPAMRTLGLPEAFVLPKADDWLAHSSMGFVEDDTYIGRNRAIMSLSPRASALRFGLLGPHLRHQSSTFESLIDKGDYESQPYLLKGFLPCLNGLLDRLEAGNAAVSKEARDYGALLWNGLLFPPFSKDRVDTHTREYKQYDKFYSHLQEGLKRVGVENLDATLLRVLRAFPDLIQDQNGNTRPFIRFQNSLTARREFETVLYYYRTEHAQKISMWDLAAGAQNAENYMDHADEFKREMATDDEPYEQGGYELYQLEWVLSYLFQRIGYQTPSSSGARLASVEEEIRAIEGTILKLEGKIEAGINKSVSVDAEIKQLEQAHRRLEELQAQTGNTQGGRLASIDEEVGEAVDYAKANGYSHVYVYLNNSVHQMIPVSDENVKPKLIGVVSEWVGERGYSLSAKDMNLYLTGPPRLRLFRGEEDSGEAGTRLAQFTYKGSSDPAELGEPYRVKLDAAGSVFTKLMELAKMKALTQEPREVIVSLYFKDDTATFILSTRAGLGDDAGARYSNHESIEILAKIKGMYPRILLNIYFGEDGRAQYISTGFRFEPLKHAENPENRDAVIQSARLLAASAELLHVPVHSTLLMSVLGEKESKAAFQDRNPTVSDLANLRLSTEPGENTRGARLTGAEIVTPGPRPEVAEFYDRAMRQAGNNTLKKVYEGGFELKEKDLAKKEEQFDRALKSLDQASRDRIQNGNILLIGPGAHTQEIEMILRALPGLNALAIVDFSWKNLEALRDLINASEKIPDGLKQKIKLYHANLLDFKPNFGNGEFDLAYSDFVYNDDFLWDEGSWRAALRELERVTAPRGVSMVRGSDDLLKKAPLSGLNVSVVPIVSGLGDDSLFILESQVALDLPQRFANTREFTEEERSPAVIEKWLFQQKIIRILSQVHPEFAGALSSNLRAYAGIKNRAFSPADYKTYLRDTLGSESSELNHWYRETVEILRSDWEQAEAFFLRESISSDSGQLKQIAEEKGNTARIRMARKILESAKTDPTLSLFIHVRDKPLTTLIEEIMPQNSFEQLSDALAKNSGARLAEESIVLKGESNASAIEIGRAYYWGMPMRTIKEIVAEIEVQKREKVSPEQVPDEIARLGDVMRREASPDPVLSGLNSAIVALNAELRVLIERDHLNAVVAIDRLMEAYVKRFNPRLREDVEGILAFAADELEPAADSDAVSNLTARLADFREWAEQTTGNGKIILLMHELNPFVVERLIQEAKNSLAGFVMDRGTISSHAVILAGGHGLPVLKVRKGAIHPDMHGNTAILRTDQLTLNPSSSDLEAAELEKTSWEAYDFEALKKSDLPAKTPDGITIGVQANADNPDAPREGAEHGAEGSGLVRTEYMFGPDNQVLKAFLEVRENDQRLRSVDTKAAYQAARQKLIEDFRDRFIALASDAPNREMTLRMYDNEEDKPMEIPNPDKKYGPEYYRTEVGEELLKIEVEAALEARIFAGGQIKILFPSYRSAESLSSFLGRGDRDLEKLSAEEKARLRQLMKEDFDFVMTKIMESVRLEMQKTKDKVGTIILENTPKGYMIELPEQIDPEVLDAILERSDFINIGTNDLTTGLFRNIKRTIRGEEIKGISRDRDEDEDYYEKLQPELLAALEKLTAIASEFNKRLNLEDRRDVCICGEIARLNRFALFAVYLKRKHGESLPLKLSAIPSVIHRLKNFIRSVEPAHTAIFNGERKDINARSLETALAISNRLMAQASNSNGSGARLAGFGTFQKPKLESIDGGIRLRQHFRIETSSGRHIFIADQHNEAAYFWLQAFKKGLIPKGSLLYHIDGHPDDEVDARSFKKLIDLKDVQSADEAQMDAWRKMIHDFYGIGSFIAPMIANGLIDPSRWYYQAELENEVFTQGLVWMPNAGTIGSPFQFAYGPAKKSISEIFQNKEELVDIVDLDVDVFQPQYKRLEAKYLKAGLSGDDARARAEEEVLTKWVPLIVPILAKAKVLSIVTSPDYINQDFAVRIVDRLMDLLNGYEPREISHFPAEAEFEDILTLEEAKAAKAIGKAAASVPPISFEEARTIAERFYPGNALPVYPDVFKALVNVATQSDPRAVVYWKLEHASTDQGSEEAQQALLGLYRNRQSLPPFERYALLKFISSLSETDRVKVARSASSQEEAAGDLSQLTMPYDQFAKNYAIQPKENKGQLRDRTLEEILETMPDGFVLSRGTSPTLFNARRAGMYPAIVVGENEVGIYSAGRVQTNILATLHAKICRLAAGEITTLEGENWFILSHEEGQTLPLTLDVLTRLGNKQDGKKIVRAKLVFEISRFDETTSRRLSLELNRLKDSIPGLEYTLYPTITEKRALTLQIISSLSGKRMSVTKWTAPGKYFNNEKDLIDFGSFPAQVIYEDSLSETPVGARLAAIPEYKEGTSAEEWGKALKAAYQKEHQDRWKSGVPFEELRIEEGLAIRYLEAIYRALRDKYGNEVADKIAFALMGSMGRGDVTYGSDVDGRIITADLEGEKSEAAMFAYDVIQAAFGEWKAIDTDHVLEMQPLSDEEIMSQLDHITYRREREYQFRIIKDEHEENLHTTTRMLDAKFAAGNQEIFSRRMANFRRQVISEKKNFIRALIQRWNDEYAESGFIEGLYEREPDLKKGVGGLRSMHFARWVGKLYLVSSGEPESGILKEPFDHLIELGVVTREEYLEARQAYDFLLRVRSKIHEINEEQEFPDPVMEGVLRFDIQDDVALGLGHQTSATVSAKSRFLKEYNDAARALFRFSSKLMRRLSDLIDKPEPGRIIEVNQELGVALVESVQGYAFRADSGFQAQSGKTLIPADSDQKTTVPVDQILPIFQYAVQTEAVISGDLLDRIERSKSGFVNRLRDNPKLIRQQFLALFAEEKSISYVLWRLHLLGFLPLLMQEFGDLTGEAQDDFVHRYTLDIHAIKLVEQFESLSHSSQTLSERIRENPRLRRLLRLALLSQTLYESRYRPQGKTLETFLKEFGVSAEDAQQIVWLHENLHTLIDHMREGTFSNREDLKGFIHTELGGDFERWNLLLAATLTQLRVLRPERYWLDEREIQPVLDISREMFDDPSGQALEKWFLKREEDRSAYADLYQQLMSEPPAYFFKFFRWKFTTSNPYLISIFNFFQEVSLKLFPSIRDRFFIQYHPVRVIVEKIQTSDRSGRSRTSSDTVQLVIGHQHEGPGVLAKIAGLVNAYGAEVLAADIDTMTKGPLTIDRYIIRNADFGNIYPEEAMEQWILLAGKMEKKIESLLEDQTSIKDVFKERHKPYLFAKKKSVFSREGKIPTNVSLKDKNGAYTVLIVETPDGDGVLHQISRLLAELEVNIQQAKIYTRGYSARVGEQAGDTFRITYRGRALPPELAKTVKNALETILTLDNADEDSFQSALAGARLAGKKPSSDENNPYKSPQPEDKIKAGLKRDALAKKLIERVKKGAYIAIDRDILEREVYNIQLDYGRKIISYNPGTEEFVIPSSFAPDLIPGERFVLNKESNARLFNEFQQAVFKRFFHHALRHALHVTKTAAYGNSQTEYSMRKFRLHVPHEDAYLFDTMDDTYHNHRLGFKISDGIFTIYHETDPLSGKEHLKINIPLPVYSKGGAQRRVSITIEDSQELQTVLHRLNVLSSQVWVSPDPAGARLALSEREKLRRRVHKNITQNGMQLYEINMRQTGRKFNEITDQNLDSLKELGMNVIWLMGVWKTTDFGEKFNKMWDTEAADSERKGKRVASAYSIDDYVINPEVGDEAALRDLVYRANKRGLAIGLDFVPNHMAADSVWVKEHPEFFITIDDAQGVTAPPLESYLIGAQDFMDKGLDKSGFYTIDTQKGPKIVAHGREHLSDEHSWIDTAQFDLSNPALQAKMIQVLERILDLTNGGAVRLDMAHYVRKSHINGAWLQPLNKKRMMEEEFWPRVIGALKEKNPTGIFIAEAYPPYESELQSYGIDFTYNSYLYRSLVTTHASTQDILRYLQDTPQAYLVRTVQYGANHDEPSGKRLAAVLDKKREQAAMVIMAAATPGAVMIYAGQEWGQSLYKPSANWLKLPGVEDTYDRDLHRFYNALLSRTRAPLFRRGEVKSLKNARISSPDVLAVQRVWKEQTALVIVNNGPASASFEWTPSEEDSPVKGGADWVDIETGSHFKFDTQKPLSFSLASYDHHILLLQPAGARLASDKKNQISVTWAPGQAPHQPVEKGSVALASDEEAVSLMLDWPTDSYRIRVTENSKDWLHLDLVDGDRNSMALDFRVLRDGAVRIGQGHPSYSETNEHLKDEVSRRKRLWFKNALFPWLYNRGFKKLRAQNLQPGGESFFKNKLKFYELFDAEDQWEFDLEKFGHLWRIRTEGGRPSGSRLASGRLRWIEEQRDSRLKEFEAFDGTVYYPFALVDFFGLLDLKKMFPKARIVLNDSLDPDHTLLIVPSNRPVTQQQIIDFLVREFSSEPRAGSSASSKYRRDSLIKKVEVVPSQAAGASQVFTVTIQLQDNLPQDLNLGDLREIRFEYRYGDFNTDDTKAGVLFVKRPGWRGEFMADPEFWRSVAGKLTAPGYVLVSTDQGYAERSKDALSEWFNFIFVEDDLDKVKPVSPHIYVGGFYVSVYRLKSQAIDIDSLTDEVIRKAYDQALAATAKTGQGENLPALAEFAKQLPFNFTIKDRDILLIIASYNKRHPESPLEFSVRELLSGLDNLLDLFRRENPKEIANIYQVSDSLEHIKILLRQGKGGLADVRESLKRLLEREKRLFNDSRFRPAREVMESVIHRLNIEIGSVPPAGQSGARLATGPGERVDYPVQKGQALRLLIPMSQEATPSGRSSRTVYYYFDRVNDFLPEGNRAYSLWKVYREASIHEMEFWRNDLSQTLKTSDGQWNLRAIEHLASNAPDQVILDRRLSQGQSWVLFDHHTATEYEILLKRVSDSQVVLSVPASVQVTPLSLEQTVTVGFNRQPLPGVAEAIEQAVSNAKGLGRRQIVLIINGRDHAYRIDYKGKTSALRRLNGLVGSGYRPVVSDNHIHLNKDAAGARLTNLTQPTKVLPAEIQEEKPAPFGDLFGRILQTPIASAEEARTDRTTVNILALAFVKLRREALDKGLIPIKFETGVAGTQFVETPDKKIHLNLYRVDQEGQQTSLGYLDLTDDVERLEKPGVAIEEIPQAALQKSQETVSAIRELVNAHQLGLEATADIVNGTPVILQVIIDPALPQGQRELWKGSKAWTGRKFQNVRFEFIDKNDANRRLDLSDTDLEEFRKQYPEAKTVLLSEYSAQESDNQAIVARAQVSGAGLIFWAKAGKDAIFPLTGMFMGGITLARRRYRDLSDSQRNLFNTLIRGKEAVSYVLNQDDFDAMKEPKVYSRDRYSRLTFKAIGRIAIDRILEGARLALQALGSAA